MTTMATRYADLVEHYEQQGYAIARGVVDADLVAEMHAHIQWTIDRHPDKSSRGLHLRDTSDPFYLRVVGDDRLLDLAEAFIGPSIAVFATAYIVKYPRSNMPILWHQDGSYWPLDPMEVTTLWLAVSESTPENGCMRVIPGTQHLTLQTMRERKDVENFLDSEIDPALVDESKAVDLVLHPGDVSIHHPNIIHGSHANQSDRQRESLVIRYIPTTTRITVPGWTHAALLRGEAPEGVNEYPPRPRYIERKHMPFRGCEAWK